MKKLSAEPTFRVDWAWRHPSGLDGVLEIVESNKPTYYYLQIISASRFLVTKVEADRRTTYDVVSVVGGKRTCGCEAGVRGRLCRHVKAVEDLRERKLL